MEMRRRKVSLLEDGREWRVAGLMYVYNLVLCGESEEDLKLMVGRFVGEDGKSMK